MEDLLLHPRTRSALEAFLRRPTHALAITGRKGVGKCFVARNLASVLLDQTNIEKLTSSQYFKHLRPLNSSLSIDQIRELQAFLRLKSTGKRSIKRVILIEDAHFMTDEAQNALLKILEEPPPDTVLILTVQGEHSLRPTVYSRMQKITLQPPAEADVLLHFSRNGYNETEVRRLFLLTDGAVGLMEAILTNDGANQLVRAVDQAKSILQSPVYERLLLVDGLAKQKELLADLFYAMKRIAHAAIAQTAHKGDSAQTKKWHVRQQRILKAETSLRSNPNPKLLLTDLFMQL